MFTNVTYYKATRLVSCLRKKNSEVHSQCKLKFKQQIKLTYTKWLFYA